MQNPGWIDVARNQGTLFVDQDTGGTFAYSIACRGHDPLHLAQGRPGA
jgi:hypothetical protein